MGCNDAAQGNALGWRVANGYALKGQDGMSPFQGLSPASTGNPGALPRAESSWPFRPQAEHEPAG